MLNIYERQKDSKNDNPLYYLGFNQGNTHFACGTKDGFLIYCCAPFKLETKRDFQNKGIGIVEMLYRSNILALVGGGQKPAFPNDRVIVWDDRKREVIGEIKCNKPVKGVKLHKNLLVVVLEDQVLIYNNDLKQTDSFETAYNPKGISTVKIFSKYYKVFVHCHQI